MTHWETLNCVNHPERVALERCEICQKPLCAYCLFYTEDGQRLCQEHGDQARALGVQVEEPGAYAAQLLGAQVGATRKHKRGEIAEDKDLYKGNQNDLISLVGLLTGVLSIAACCGAGYCLPLVGFGLSLIAVINAKRAYDPGRTRRLGLIGLAASGIWVALLVGCIFVYGMSISTFFANINDINNWLPTPLPYSTSTPTLTPESTRAPFPGRTPTPTDQPAVLETETESGAPVLWLAGDWEPSDSELH